MILRQWTILSSSVYGSEIASKCWNLSYMRTIEEKLSIMIKMEIKVTHAVNRYLQYLILINLKGKKKLHELEVRKR